jgi:ATP-dependent protease HslVU (ClpYQ) peptidase subunit
LFHQTVWNKIVCKGGDFVDIAAISLALSQNSTQRAIGASVMKIALNFDKVTNANLLSMMLPPSPTLGRNLDIGA